MNTFTNVGRCERLFKDIVLRIYHDVYIISLSGTLQGATCTSHIPQPNGIVVVHTT